MDRNGNVYNSKGKLYQGSNSFVTKTVTTLRKLDRSSNKEVRSVLKSLEGSPQKHTIELGFNGSGTSPTEGKDAANNGVKSGTTVDIDYTQKGEDGKVVSSEDLVGHELYHSYDYQNGNMKGEMNQNPSNTDPRGIRAVKFENKIRATEKEKPRTTYGGKKIDPKKLAN